MKITKIKTRGGELGAPVTTDFETIVERMRSDDTKDAAKRVGTVALHDMHQYDDLKENMQDMQVDISWHLL